MRFRFFPAVLFLSFASILFCGHRLWSQVVPTAEEQGLRLAAGGGFANEDISLTEFGIDSGQRMSGLAVWADWDMSGYRFIPNGLKIEGEAKTIRFGAPQGISPLREDTLMGGFLYSWKSWKRHPDLRPYGKALVGVGGIDFPGINWTHDTRSAAELGGGIDYRLHRNIWLRAEYDYQIWESLFGNSKIGNPGVNLHPNGFTIGAMYNFRHRTTFR